MAGAVSADPDQHDPVRARRRLMGRLARLGKRLGYGCLAVALVVFMVGAAGDFTPAIVAVVVTALAVGSVLLLPAIVIGYGVSAAERDDRVRGDTS
ncbi:MAG TPA: hypothetical protein VE760_00885 [Acidimicrobiales bacterium]|nr:hypothetical protein [Acidimicrobiales bacterium]